MDPIDGPLGAENIQRPHTVGKLHKVNANAGGCDRNIRISALMCARQRCVSVGARRANDDNPAIRRELKDVAIIEFELADHEGRDRRHLRITVNGHRGLQHLGRFSSGLQSSFSPLHLVVLSLVRPG